MRNQKTCKIGRPWGNVGPKKSLHNKDSSKSRRIINQYKAPTAKRDPRLLKKLTTTKFTLISVYLHTGRTGAGSHIDMIDFWSFVQMQYWKIFYFMISSMATIGINEKIQESDSSNYLCVSVIYTTLTMWILFFCILFSVCNIQFWSWKTK